MKCPNCNNKLKNTVLNNTEIGYCSSCLGTWFEKDELRQAKDEKDLEWLDVDLWKDEHKFKIAKGKKICPKCSVPFYQVNYDDSNIQIDICNLCKGVYLDRGEFAKIIEYLKAKEAYEVYNHYFKNLVKEFGEIVIGSEELKSEVKDFLAILKLIALKYPAMQKIIDALPK